MTRVRIDLNISLDGFATTTDQTPENPFGDDWGRLTRDYVATRTFRERVLHDTTGAGTTGIDDKYAENYFAEIGAEIMGAGMFGLHEHGDKPNWRGWWGDEPPFRIPVFVLTHTRRPPIAFDNGTVFHFLSSSPEDVLRMAVAAADGKDVRIGGGASTARAFLQADLVDDLHVAIVPILLGRGERLWDGLREFESGRDVVAETAESGVVHLTFTRRG